MDKAKFNISKVLSESEFSDIIDKNTKISILGLDGHFIYVSEALSSFLDYKTSDLIRKPFSILNPDQYKSESFNKWLTSIKENEYWTDIIEIKTKKKQPLQSRCTISHINNSNNEIKCFFILLENATNYKNIDEYINKDKSYKWFFCKSPLPKSLIALSTLTYIDVNKSWQNYTGYSKEEAIGVSPNDLKLHNLLDQKLLEKIRITKKTSFKTNETTLINKEGDKKFAIVSFELIYINKKAYLLKVIKDITHCIMFQKELAKKAIQKKDALLKLTEIIGGNFDKTLEKITSISAKMLNVERVSIWNFNKDASSMVCLNAYNLSTGIYSNTLKFKADNYPNYFESLKRNKIIKVNNVLEHEATKKLADTYFNPLGITSTLDILIPYNNGNYGIICFEHIGTARKWTFEEEEFAAAIANIVALAIENRERRIVETQLLEVNDKLVNANNELRDLKKDLEKQNSYLREEIDLVFNYEEMVYGSAAFSKILTDAESVAETNATVLLLGESGTGKELLARAIHNISNRKDKPLIKVNCAAIPRELIESELFGHKKGSFTGAFSDKEGKFKLADGGTLFLDEIGELPLDLQPKLLRAIQESEIEQIGGTQVQKVDIRIIAATNRNLEQEVQNKNFREDLYFRINVFPILIPPLRDRPEDIPILIEHFVDKFCKKYNKSIKLISKDTKNKLQNYKWPGNIRELENLIERSVILSNNETLFVPGFKSASKELPISSTVLTLEEAQRIHIKQVLKQCNWKISGPRSASELLDVKPSTLRDKIKKLHIEKS
jgi:PAS domain S-box-containing protein